MQTCVGLTIGWAHQNQFVEVLLRMFRLPPNPAKQGNKQQTTLSTPLRKPNDRGIVSIVYNTFLGIGKQPYASTPVLWDVMLVGIGTRG